MTAAVFVAGLGNLPTPSQDTASASSSSMACPPSGHPHGLCPRWHHGQRTVTLGDTTVALTLFKSKSLMNISGPSIATAARTAVRLPSRMIVLADSLSHRPQTVSPKLGGSANGHNGIKSLIAALGGEAGFHRLRLGIGRDEGSDAAIMCCSSCRGTSAASGPGKALTWSCRDREDRAEDGVRAAVVVTTT
ncbi:peptidyl-tRNA hydrolase [Pholiota molesta]|nr:peptidyl-tRNA hydrolase [Pholiota molesta]